jgi:energy-coupling factor transporter ATP-binding protein EcfA2
MIKKTEAVESQLNSPEVDKLLVLCEEVMRATPEGAHRFIEPAPGVLSRAKSKQHNIIFGRRGSGKSSLLRKMAADLTVDRRPIAFVDMETFKGHSYPDVLISVLIKSLHEFKKWLDGAAVTPATKTSFWKKLFGTKPQRPPFNKLKTITLSTSLARLISDLEAQLRAPESAAKQIKKSSVSENGLTLKVTAGVGTPGASLKTQVKGATKTNSTAEEQSTYVSHKIEYLHQHILSFQNFFQELSGLSDGPSFLILDDLYHIRKSDQPKVVDYFHRIGKGNGMWLKVGTIKHRSQWYQHSDPPIGMKLGDDAKEINLDISLEKFETLREFLRKILNSLMAEIPPLTMGDLMNRTAIDRLIVASGGVTRDFIGIFSGAISQAKNRPAGDSRGPKIGAEDVNRASGDYDPMKREEFKLDTDSDRDVLEKAFQELATFCTEKSKCNIFLVSQKLKGPVRDAVDQLIDLRLIHPVKSRVTLKTGAKGELFEAYMLDLSQYTAARKVQNFQMLDLSAKETDEALRKGSLIYSGE